MRDPRTLSLSAALLLALGCPSEPDLKEDSDDTLEDTGDPVVYEEGCITVDGGGGYASLNDAIHLADEGATIELCEGSFEEAVVVDKAVHIVGAGADLTLWSAPSNEAAFMFQGVTGASLTGVDIASTRSGIEIESSPDLALSDLAFELIPNYAIDADDSTGLSVTASSFVESQWGAVKVDGGDATISGCSFVDNLGFAIKGTGDADLSVQQNEISGTMYTELNDDKGIEDGFAVHLVEAGEATLSENVFTDNPILAVMSDSCEGLSMSGDSITGGLYGIFMVYGDIDLVDVSITDPTAYGVYWIGPAGELFSASGLAISGDPEVVSNYDWDEGVADSTGLFAQGDHFDISDSSINGYNSYGALISGYGTEDGEIVLDEVSFTNNGRRGLATMDLDVVATNLSVTGLRELDEDYCIDEVCYTYIDLPAAWYHQNANLELTGGSFEDNQGWGLSSAAANANVQQVTFSGNSQASFFDYQGTSTLEGNLFTGNPESVNWGALCAYESNGMVVTGNEFSDNYAIQKEYSFTSGHDKYEYVYHDLVPDSGTDLFAYNTDITIQDNTFHDGYVGAQLSSSDGTVSGNTFSNYAYAAVYVSGEGSDAVSVQSNAVSDNIGNGVVASSANVEIEDLSFTDGQSAQISYDVYRNGKKYYSSSYNTSYDGVYASYGTVLVEDSEIDSPAGDGISTYNAVLEVDGVTIRNASKGYGYGYGLYAYHYSWEHSPADVEIYVNDLSIEDPIYGGIYLSSNDSTAFVAAQFVDTEITQSDKANAISYAVQLSSVGSGEDAVLFEGLEINGTPGFGYGIYASSASVSLNDATISDATTAAVYGTSSTVELTGSTLDANTGSGLLFSSGTLSVTDSVLASNIGTGAAMSSATATFTGNTVTKNQAYGITCSAVSFDACGDNLLMGNSPDDNSGCDVACLEPLAPVDTGAP